MIQPKSAYSFIAQEEKIERHTFAVLVDNRPGVLARVIGMFSARGYNIECLTVAPVDMEKKISRITIVTTGTPRTIAQIKAQLSRIVAVHTAVDLHDYEHIEKEIALVKVKSNDTDRREALRIAEVFKAEVVDTTLETFQFMIEGDAKRVSQFIELLEQIGQVEVARSGVVAMSCGSDILSVYYIHNNYKSIERIK